MQKLLSRSGYSLQPNLRLQIWSTPNLLSAEAPKPGSFARVAFLHLQRRSGPVIQKPLASDQTD